MCLRIFTVLACLLFSQIAKSEEEERDTEQKMNPVKMFFVAEGLIALNAWMAAQNPNVYGGAGALLFPIAGCEHLEKICIPSIVALESLAVYNLTLDSDEMTESEIFQSNVVGWHIVMGTIGALSYLAKDEKKEVSAIPLPGGGGLLTFSYKF